MKQIAITIDMETDWGGRLSVNSANCKGIEKEIPYILKLFVELSIKATFFVSGEIINSYGDLIREIHDNGHEIASHGFNHNIKYDELSTMEINEQISISKDLIEQTIGISPLGFRSPQLRINGSLHHALSKQGFIYDSSAIKGYFPTRYHYKNVPSMPFNIDGLWEIPISTLPLINIPMGLLWINALGFCVFESLFNKFEYNDVYIFYLHPFDLVENKSKNDFNFVINNWYNFKSKNVKITFERLLSYLSTKGEFTPLIDILKKQNGWSD